MRHKKLISIIIPELKNWTAEECRLPSFPTMQTQQPHSYGQSLMAVYSPWCLFWNSAASKYAEITLFMLTTESDCIQHSYAIKVVEVWRHLTSLSSIKSSPGCQTAQQTWYKCCIHKHTNTDWGINSTRWGTQAQMTACSSAVEFWSQGMSQRPVTQWTPCQWAERSWSKGSVLTLTRVRETTKKFYAL